MSGSAFVPRAVRLIPILLVAVLLGGCATAAPPDAGAQRREVAAIQAAFPLLAELGVTSFEDTSVCQQLDYRRGRFTDQAREGRCQDVESAQIDEAAIADLRRIDEALGNAEIRVLSGDLVLGGNGAVGSATFSVTGGAFDRFTFYYESDGTPPEDWDADTTVADQVNTNWWFANQDWN